MLGGLLISCWQKVMVFFSRGYTLEKAGMNVYTCIVHCINTRVTHNTKNNLRTTDPYQMPFYPS